MLTRVTPRHTLHTGPESTPPSGVTVVIPAHDEAGRIGSTVALARPYADEIIVVDDGSSDGTSDEAGRAGATVIRLDPGRGYIGAIKAGFQAARGEVIVTLDGDGEHPPSAIPDLVGPILDGSADMVQGARAHAPRPSEAFLTWLAGRIAPVGDSGTGMRAIKADLARSLQIEGRCICGSLTLEAIRHGARVLDVPITLQDIDEDRSIAWFHLMQTRAVVHEMWRLIRASKGLPTGTGSQESQ